MGDKRTPGSIKDQRNQIRRKVVFRPKYCTENTDWNRIRKHITCFENGLGSARKSFC